MAITSDKTDEQIEAENEAYAQSLENDIEYKLNSIKQILVNQITQACQNINTLLSNNNTNNISQFKNLYNHIHKMHKHGFLRGHNYSECLNSDCIDQSKKCEKNLGCFYPNIVSFVRLLYSEYITMTDKDDNGLIFFKDFYIDYSDSEAPLLIKSLLYNIYFPVTRKYPYETPLGIPIVFDEKFINYDFKWDGKTFTYIKIPRSSPLKMFTWEDYLNTISHLKNP